LDELSNQASLIALILSIITGTIYSDIQGSKNAKLKKANYYSLASCFILFFSLIRANEKYLNEMNINLVQILLFFYLTMYSLNYILFVIIDFCKNPFRKIWVKIVTVLICSAISISLSLYVLNLDTVYKYIPKDTIVKIYDNENNYFLLKTEKDIPIEFNYTPVYSSDKFKTHFRKDVNKFILKAGTEITVFADSSFTRVETNDSLEKDESYKKDWGSLEGVSTCELNISDNDTSFVLSENLKVTIVEDTILTIYMNSILIVLRFYVGISMIVIILLEIIYNCIYIYFISEPKMEHLYKL